MLEESPPYRLAEPPRVNSNGSCSRAKARKAKEIVERSGANSEQHFNRVVLGGVTFREQAKAYMHWVVTRDRKPLKDAHSIQAALNKWISPAIGDMPWAMSTTLR
jgi:hypothetical protein